MASKSTSGTKQRAQGGGRTSNSEPRVQVFKEFAGCNFQQSPRQFTLGVQPIEEQSDLQMNYVVIQNNAEIADNKTIETRRNIIKLFDAPIDRKLTDAAILVDDELYVGCEDGWLFWGKLGTGKFDPNAVALNNRTGTDHHWQSFVYVDDQLVATTKENQLWSGKIGSHLLSNAKKVEDPAAYNFSQLLPRGSLKISQTMTDECCFRIAVAHTFVNKYGPTATSRQLSFYANYPVDEWHSGCYLQIAGMAPIGYGINAIEIYYTVGNSSSLQFAGRVDVDDGGYYYFDWVGYLDVTSMWPMANLLSPTENVTEGVKASHMTCIDGRMYFWGSNDEPYRLWIGGNPGNLLNIAPGTGGGFVDVEPGSGQEIRVVDKYKTQSGNSIVTMLCDSNNSSREQRYNLVENTITISNEQNMKSWQAEQVAGAVGCKSYHGARVCEDGLYSISRYGLALTTMTMEYNSQIRANYVSDAIKPVFTDKNGNILDNSVLLECDGILYLCFGKNSGELDNLLFCYDIDLKAWWTISLDIDEPILNMIHIDYEGFQEGIGIITPNAVYLLPTTDNEMFEDEDANFDVKIVTGELSTAQPQQNWFYLSQLEFRFDRFCGEIDVELDAIDQFGRRIKTKKTISHKDRTVYGLVEYMRVDLRIQSYKLTITGRASFRMTHFMAKLYLMSARVGQVWGFDDSQSFRTSGDIHPTFKSYNDIRNAIIP